MLNYSLLNYTDSQTCNECHVSQKIDGYDEKPHQCTNMTFSFTKWLFEHKNRSTVVVH
jgi:hypothetical protein